MIRLERRLTPAIDDTVVVIDGEALDLMIDRMQGVAIYFGILVFLAVFWTLSLHAVGLV